jgi:hypothetical protein
MKRLLYKLECIFLGHEYEYIGRDSDWLWGGHYFYQCDRCGDTKTTTPYLGGRR